MSKNVSPPKNIGKISDFSAIKKGALTIGMSTYDDFDGVYFTIQSIRLHHQEILDRLSFIVIDNKPGTPVGAALQEFGKNVKNYQYIPFSEFNSTAVRDVFFREADTEYVMSLDSHVLIEAGAIKQLLDYLDNHPDSMDLIQGPLIYDSLDGNYATGFFPKWQKGMYGYWETDPRGANPNNEPFEITMQGLGLFACRKIAWPGFNPRFRGFGGEEGYIQEKFRRNGHRTLCLPALRWVHRFFRPAGTKYPMNWSDRIYNYHLGWKEIGWDTSSINDHFKDLLGAGPFETIITQVYQDINNPLSYFDAVYYLYTEQEPKVLSHPFIETWSLQRIIRYYPAKAINYAKDRADIIDQAVRFGLGHVLIIDSRAPIEKNFIKHMMDVVKHMKVAKWSSWYLDKDEAGQLQSNFFEESYAAEKKLPEHSFISAFFLGHFYGSP